MDTKLPTAQEAAIGFARRLRAAGSRRGHRLRQPRRRAAELHELGRRPRAGDPANVGRRLDVAVQRRLHRAEGSEEGRGAQRRGNPAPGDRRALRRRGHVEPAAVRRSARPGASAPRRRSTRSACGRTTPRAAARSCSRKRSSCCASSRRRPAAGRSFPTRSTDLTGVYGQISDELSSQYTVGYTSKNRRRDGAWRRVVVAVNRPSTTAADQAGLLRRRRPADSRR